jgi:hypothetical protein
VVADAARGERTRASAPTVTTANKREANKREAGKRAATERGGKRRGLRSITGTVAALLEGLGMREESSWMVQKLHSLR